MKLFDKHKLFKAAQRIEMELYIAEYGISYESPCAAFIFDSREKALDKIKYFKELTEDDNTYYYVVRGPIHLGTDIYECDNTEIK